MVLQKTNIYSLWGLQGTTGMLCCPKCTLVGRKRVIWDISISLSSSILLTFCLLHLVLKTFPHSSPSLSWLLGPFAGFDLPCCHSFTGFKQKFKKPTFSTFKTRLPVTICGATLYFFVRGFVISKNSLLTSAQRSRVPHRISSPTPRN